MKKTDRDAVAAKTNNRCAYCGCELEKGWHVDHILPIERKSRYDRKLCKFVPTGECRHPDRDTTENMFAACPSCNINKHSFGVEVFRKMISGYVVSLNRDSTQYKMAKKYGLISETNKEVLFYFETL